MPLIAASDQDTLRTLFDERLQGDVTITYFTQHESKLIVPGQECALCAQTREILQEVAELSDKVHLEVKDFVRDAEAAKELGVDRIPAFVLEGKAQGKVRYFGIPSGYEFSSLIEDLLDVSAGTTDLSEKTRKSLEAIDQDVHIQVFVTPTCPYCPLAVRLAHKLAVENPYITADVIEATEFPELVQRYNIFGVPKTVINDRVEVEGALREPQFMQQVLGALDSNGLSTQA
jgi:glutaredoxin-like protein